MYHLNAKFRSVYTPECYVPVDESLMTWKVYIPSKRSRFGTKSFELCEAKSGYVWNFIIYTVQDTVFDESLKKESYCSKEVLQLMAPLLHQRYHLEEQFSSFIHTRLEFIRNCLSMRQPHCDAISRAGSGCFCWTVLSANYYDRVSVIYTRRRSRLRILNVHDSGICIRSCSMNRNESHW
jgi:hypothetical protein